MAAPVGRAEAGGAGAAGIRGTVLLWPSATEPVSAPTGSRLGTDGGGGGRSDAIAPNLGVDPTPTTDWRQVRSMTFVTILDHDSGSGAEPRAARSRSGMTTVSLVPGTTQTFTMSAVNTGALRTLPSTRIWKDVRPQRLTPHRTTSSS